MKFYITNIYFSKYYNNIHSVIKEPQCLKTLEYLKIYLQSDKGKNAVNSKDKHDLTPLMNLVSSVHNTSGIELLKLLIQNGANVDLKNEFGMTALMLASEISLRYCFPMAYNWNQLQNILISEEIYKLLIKNGANVNLQNNIGLTALMIVAKVSCKLTSIEKIKLLIDNNANINLQDNDGNTALMHVSKNSDVSSLETIKLLIENGANINLQNKYGDTALMIAIQHLNKYSSIEIIKFLIDNKANINLQNNAGNTALIYASKLSHKNSSDIVKLLIES